MQRLGVRGAVIGGHYVPGDISVSDGVVNQVGLPPGKGGLAVPGFVDLQVNGFGGVDFATATTEEWREANALLTSTGVTTYLANLISHRPEVTTQAVEVARVIHGSPQEGCAHLRGLHIEGPFLSAEKAGIHSRHVLQDPSPELVASWREAGPLVMTTLAPELPGAIEMIRNLVDQGVVVSLGHSNSTADEARAGFDAGATSVTHIFNAMSGITARAPGLAGMALSRADVWLQLILDFLHVDRTIVELLLSFAPGRIVLVTDCLPITGTSGTRFNLAGTDVELREGKAVNSEGVLAGSVVSMDEALRNALSCGMGEVDAVNATSLNALKLLNPHGPAPLEPGQPADVVVLDDSWNIDTVFVHGANVTLQEVL